MALFNKPQQQMVLDLLISENPRLAGVVLGTHVEFYGKPVADGSGVVTARLRGKRGAGFTGVKAFTYTRIHLGRLFTNSVMQIQLYSAQSSLDLIPAINARYGLTLVASEMVNYGIAANLTATNISITTGTDTSFVYEGAVGCRWTRGVMQLTDYYPQRTLTALTIPDLMLKAFQIDFSSALATLQAHNTTVAFSSASSTAQAIVAMLATRTGLPVTLSPTTTPGSDPYDLSGFMLSFTTPEVLQDSRPDYRKIAVLTPPVVYGNQYVPIYLHYDKVGLLRTADVVTVTELAGLVAPTK